jgi:hypothetical protein
MSVTVPRRHAQESGDGSTVSPEREDAERREAAIASLKRKRKFVQDVAVYVMVNGVLWLIWALSDRSSDGSMPWPAWVSAIWGFFLALDAWRAFVRWPVSLDQPITEADIRRELMRSGRGQ